MDKILLVSQRCFLSNCMLGMDYSDYVEFQMRFIDELDDCLRRKLVI